MKLEIFTIFIIATVHISGSDAEENLCPEIDNVAYDLIRRAAESVGTRLPQEQPRYPERRPYEEQPRYPERRPFEEQPRYPERRPFEEQPRYPERRPFEEQPRYPERRPFEKQPRYPERRPFEEQPRYPERRPFEEQPRYPERRPFEEQPRYPERRPFEEQPRYPERRPFEEQPRYPERRPFEEQPRYPERRPFEEQPRYPERRPSEERLSSRQRGSVTFNGFTFPTDSDHIYKYQYMYDIYGIVTGKTCNDGSNVDMSAEAQVNDVYYKVVCEPDGTGKLESVLYIRRDPNQNYYRPSVVDLTPKSAAAN